MKVYDLKELNRITNDLVLNPFVNHYWELFSSEVEALKNQNFSIEILIDKAFSPDLEDERINIKGLKKTADMEKVNMDTAELNTNSTFDTLKTFQTFVVGDFNRFAYESALQFCNPKESATPNPLVLIGNKGFGKTHLAIAILNEIRQKLPERLSIYINAADFLSQITNAIITNKRNEFFAQFKSFEVLIIDDFQCFKDREVSQGMLVDILNSHFQNQHQVLVTSDIPITEANGFIHRLASRLNGGVTTLIENPNFESRFRILENKAIGRSISEQVLQFIAEKDELDIRQMEGFLSSLIAHSELIQKGIDLDVAMGTFALFK